MPPRKKKHSRSSPRPSVNATRPSKRSIGPLPRIRACPTRALLLPVLLPPSPPQRPSRLRRRIPLLRLIPPTAWWRRNCAISSQPRQTRSFNKKERAATETFYQAQNFAPIWLDKGIENARARSVIARLHGADADGLDPKDYATQGFAGLAP